MSASPEEYKWRELLAPYAITHFVEGDEVVLFRYYGHNDYRISILKVCRDGFRWSGKVLKTFLPPGEHPGDNPTWIISMSNVMFYYTKDVLDVLLLVLALK